MRHQKWRTNYPYPLHSGKRHSSVLMCFEAFRCNQNILSKLVVDLLEGTKSFLLNGTVEKKQVTPHTSGFLFCILGTITELQQLAASFCSMQNATWYMSNFLDQQCHHSPIKERSCFIFHSFVWLARQGRKWGSALGRLRNYAINTVRSAFENSIIKVGCKRSSSRDGISIWRHHDVTNCKTSGVIMISENVASNDCHHITLSLAQSWVDHGAKAGKLLFEGEK